MDCASVNLISDSILIAAGGLDKVIKENNSVVSYFYLVLDLLCHSEQITDYMIAWFARGFNLEFFDFYFNDFLNAVTIFDNLQTIEFLTKFTKHINNVKRQQDAMLER